MAGNWRKRAVPPRAGARARGFQEPAGPPGDLRGEIAALRAAIHQVSEQAAAVDTLAERLRVLDGLGRACVRLANLLRAQRALEEEQAAAALSRALDAINTSGD
jgi:hypothetical protein